MNPVENISKESLRRLEDLLVDESLFQRQKLAILLNGVHKSFLAEFSSNTDLKERHRLREDLKVINATDYMEDGELPMRVLLENAKRDILDRKVVPTLNGFINELEQNVGTAERASRNAVSLYFLGRETCWQEAWVHIQTEFSLPRHFEMPDPSGAEPSKSKAILWEYESSSDMPEHLATAICLWIRSEGKIEGDFSLRTDFSDFYWTPQFKNVEVVFQSIFQKLDDENGGSSVASLAARPETLDSVEIYKDNTIRLMNDRHVSSFACICTIIPPSMSPSSRLVAQNFVAEWNSQEWSALSKPLLFIVFVGQQAPGLVGRVLGRIGLSKRNNSSNSMVGKIDKDSYLNWYNFFAKALANNSWDRKLRDFEKEIQSESWKDLRFDKLAERLGVR